MINVDATLNKLQKVVTYTKKSAKGWLCYASVCLHHSLPAVKFWNPVKKSALNRGGKTFAIFLNAQP